MAGIVGLYTRNGSPVDREVLRKMTSSLSHRGPDGFNHWAMDSVGLGHLKLITTPESVYESLPIESSRGNTVLTCDARIDNREELGSLLGIYNGELTSLSDGELILRSYEKWGQSCPDYLLGAFAFAIWDSSNQYLFCSRDHFGVKPFYYYMDDHLFAFASEIKALLVVPGVPRKFNEVRIGDFLAGNYEDTVSTYYEHIFRLEAASQMVVGSSKHKKATYWTLNPQSEMRLGSDEAYAEAFRDVFSEAVRCRMRTVQPVGTFLSGGLDSSSVTCMARDLAVASGGALPHTFSSVFDTVEESDERDYIQKVIDQGNVTPHFVTADKQSVLQTQLDGWVPGYEDEPILAPNMHITWYQYKTAKKLGIRVMLEGFDGDTTISHGVGYLNELAHAGKWMSLIAEVRGYAKVQSGSVRDIVASYMRRHLSWYRRMSRIQRRLFPRAKSTPSKPIWAQLMNPEFARRINIEERHKVEQAIFKSTPKERENHFRLLSRGVMPSINEIIDRASSSFGIEAWFPFWDKRLVEFCLSLPPEQKLSQGWTRLILRRGLEGVLPKEIQWRTDKSNLGPGFIHVLRTREKDFAKKLFDNAPTPVIENYVDVAAFKETWERFLSTSSLDENEYALVLWKILALQIWIRQVREEGSLHS